MSPAQTNFYGVTTVGIKGQVVIPAEARAELNLKPGDKVIVFGKKNAAEGYGMVCICPISTAEKFLESLSRHATETEALLQQAKKEV